MFLVVFIYTTLNSIYTDQINFITKTSIPLLIISSLPLGSNISNYLDTLLRRISNYYIDIMLICCALTISYQCAYLDYSFQDIKTAPIQLVLCLLGLNGLHSKIEISIARNLIVSLLSGLITYNINYPYFLSTCLVFIISPIVSSYISMIILTFQRKEFFSNHQLRSINKHYFSEMKKSYYPHQRDMLKLKYNLDDTMRIDSKEAIVVEVDLINSSKYQGQEIFRELKNKFFSSCYDLMMRNYYWDITLENKPICEVYKFKELGDGFISTIDYPFTFPINKNRTKFVLEFSYEIESLFNLIFKDSEFEINLSIVANKSLLQGFWSSPPATRYDLHQSGISKTARISSLRRVIQKRLPKYDNILLICEKLYEEFDSSDINEFYQFDLKANKLQIRNYENDDFLYISNFKKDIEQEIVS